MARGEVQDDNSDGARDVAWGPPEDPMACGLLSPLLRALLIPPLGIGALHQPRPFNHAPKNHVRTVDQIGRAVVRAVIAEDAAARTTGAALRRSQWGSWFDESETEGSVPLGSRLAINPWGGLMLVRVFAFREECAKLMVRMRAGAGEALP